LLPFSHGVKFSARKHLFFKTTKTAEIKFDFKRAKNYSTCLNSIFCLMKSFSLFSGRHASKIQQQMSRKCIMTNPLINPSQRVHLDKATLFLAEVAIA
jgi:hypothetical protein